jgi:hypothetical protein
MGQAGIPFPMDTPWWQYDTCCAHPFVVIGEPIFEREQPQLVDDKSGRGLDRLYCGFRYIPMRVAKGTSNLYRTTSYGQLGRDVIFNHALLQIKRGRFIVDYFSLLLRRSRKHGIPDGEFMVYGNAHEPLYLHYFSRRAMQFYMSLEWDVFRGAADEWADQEHALYMELCDIATDLIVRIFSECESRRCYLDIQSDLIEKSVMISVFPELETGENLQAGVGNDEPRQRGQSQQSPEGVFQMFGNVFRRLPTLRVRCYRVERSDEKSGEWKIELERLRDEVCESTPHQFTQEQCT